MLEEGEERGGNRGEDVERTEEMQEQGSPPSKPPAQLTLRCAQGNPEAPSSQQQQWKCHCHLALQPPTPTPQVLSTRNSTFPLPNSNLNHGSWDQHNHPTLCAHIWALTTTLDHPQTTLNHPLFL